MAIGPSLTAEPLFASDLSPVCAPAIATRLRQPKDLTGESLIRVQHAPEDWPRWLAAIGTESPSNYGSKFEFYCQALPAALDGVSVAMGIRPYVSDDLISPPAASSRPSSIPSPKAPNGIWWTNPAGWKTCPFKYFMLG